MDALKAEIAAKRKATETDTGRPKKYMRKGDVERMRLEEEQREKEEKDRAAREKEEQERQANVSSISLTSRVWRGLYHQRRYLVWMPLHLPLPSGAYSVSSFGLIVMEAKWKRAFTQTNSLPKCGHYLRKS